MFTYVNIGQLKVNNIITFNSPLENTWSHNHSQSTQHKNTYSETIIKLNKLEQLIPYLVHGKGVNLYFIAECSWQDIKGTTDGRNRQQVEWELSKVSEISHIHSRSHPQPAVHFRLIYCCPISTLQSICLCRRKLWVANQDNATHPRENGVPFWVMTHTLRTFLLKQRSHYKSVRFWIWQLTIWDRTQLYQYTQRIKLTC